MTEPASLSSTEGGVRQGDSLSPMLFIIVMEAFARLVHSAAESRLLRPTEAAPIRHHCSIYADDVILFMHPSTEEANAIKTILHIFGDASGLRMNLGKCSIMPIHIPEDNTQQIQAILGCQLVDFPITYLGLPLSVKKVPKAKIQSAVDAVARRMSSRHPGPSPLLHRAADKMAMVAACQRKSCLG